MHDFQKLIIWQKPINITEDVYHLSEKFPRKEKYGFPRQIRRSAISVSSNIAVDAERNSDKEFRQFLSISSISSGSSNELLTKLYLSSRHGLISEQIVSPILDQLIEVKKINYSLIKKFSK